jgi:Outer membrane protein beta-barrel domain
MKKITLILLGLTLFTFVDAQPKFGIRGGYNISNLTTSGVLSYGNQQAISSFNAGLMGNLPFSDAFSLQLEVQYSGQGTDYQDNNRKGNLRYGYLNIPVLIKYQHESGLFAETGLQIGFPVSTKETLNGVSVHPQNELYNNDFAWPIGLGYQFLHSGLGIDVRYNYGLINIVKSSSDVNVKNSVFQFDLYFLFGANE